MSKPMKKIFNCATGETIEQEMTAAEFAQYQTDQADFEKSKLEENAKAQSKADLLARVGLSAEEAALLLG
jgi:hypothetical protein